MGNGGVGVWNAGVAKLFGCIVLFNGSDLVDETGLAAVRYSNVGGIAGDVDGDIDANPLFTDAPKGNSGPLWESPWVDAADNVDVSCLDRFDLAGAACFHDVELAADTGNPDGIRPATDMGAYEASERPRPRGSQEQRRPPPIRCARALPPKEVIRLHVAKTGLSTYLSPVEPPYPPEPNDHDRPQGAGRNP